MNKAYNRINWENYPSDSTPLNEDNLNKMDIAINEVDNRVISLDTTKLPVATAYTMVKDVAFDEKTGIFTITKLNGSVIKIDTALEKISTNFRFDYSTQKLILTLIDGTTQEVDLSALLTQYEFTDSDTIAFTIDTSGKVVASVKKGSITQDMLEPNYLANIKVEVAKAESASLSADTSAKNAEMSAINAKNSEEKAKEYAQAASGEAILEIQTIVGGEINENTGETNVEYSVPQESEGKWSLSTVLGGSVVNALKQATKAITEEFVKISDYFAKKSLYGDTTINVGRKADSTVGRYSTAEGYFNIASKNCAHAEGEATIAGEYCAHAEGSATTANGECSHVEGYETIASGIFSHVQGKYNVEDTENKYAHIVGGGTSDTERKNIHTLDWDGNAKFSGNVVGKNILSSLAECTASTNDTDIASASALAELNNSLSGKILTCTKAITSVFNNVTSISIDFSSYGVECAFFEIDLWGGRWQGSSMLHAKTVAWYYAKDYGAGYYFQDIGNSNSDMSISGSALSGTVLTINFSTNISYVMTRANVMKAVNA